MATLAPDLELRNALSRLIGDAGYYCQRIVRVLPPFDVGGDCEVLFIGRARDQADRGAGPLTAYVADREGAEALISDGW